MSSIVEDFYRLKALWFYYHVFDTDGNGIITFDDFDRTALKYAAYQCKGAYKADIYEGFQKIYHDIWRELKDAADVNMDDQVDFPEWENYLKKIAENSKSFEDLPQYLRAFIEHHFNSYDMNKDGMIDVNEYRLYLCARNMNIRQADECFTSMLMDSEKKSGKINKQRFNQMMFDYLTSHDKTSKSNFICGPFDTARKDVLEKYAKLARAS